MKRILFLIGLWLLSCSLGFAFTLSSHEFKNNGPIPKLYTCQGENISPSLIWSDPPAGTQSYLLAMVDRDTQKTHGFIYIHWILFDIHGDYRGVRVNTTEGDAGRNSKNHAGYDGPCPPPGTGPHHYIFQLYALDVPDLELAPGAPLEEIDEVSKGHVLGTAQLVGTYEHQ